MLYIQTIAVKCTSQALHNALAVAKTDICRHTCPRSSQSLQLDCGIHFSMDSTVWKELAKGIMNLSDKVLEIMPMVTTRAGHAYAKYAKYADYAHMRNMRMRIENLIHIFHIQREKN